MAGKKKEQKEKKEKPLERWTIKELRDEALKIPNISGVHGMNKEEIVEIIREVKGIPAPETKKKTVNVREIKVKIVDLKKTRDEERDQNATRQRLNLLRRKISKLKKRTRV